MTKDDGQASVLAGTAGHAWLITVTNSGPSDADSVRLDDAVPAALSAGSPSADRGADCSASAGNTIACSLPASLAPGATWTISVPYAVGSGVPAQTVTNTAVATSAENPAGVSATDQTDVTIAAPPTTDPHPSAYADPWPNRQPGRDRRTPRQPDREPVSRRRARPSSRAHLSSRRHQRRPKRPKPRARRPHRPGREQPSRRGSNHGIRRFRRRLGTWRPMVDRGVHRRLVDARCGPRALRRARIPPPSTAARPSDLRRLSGLDPRAIL